MADPFKLRVLKALTAALKEISVAGGYSVNLADFNPGDGVAASRVHRGRAWFGENDALPMLSILEGTSPADEVAEAPIVSTSGEVDWPVLIQGFVEDDAANPTDPAYALLADVRRRLAVERKADSQGDRALLGFNTGRNQVTDIRFGSGVVRPADDVSSKAWFWLSLTIRIVENAELPYA